MWFNGRVRHDPGGKLSAAAAHADYAETCQINAYPALSQKKFGELMTAKAEASGGRITKFKQGTNFYAGIALAGERSDMEIEMDGFRPQPYRA